MNSSFETRGPTGAMVYVVDVDEDEDEEEAKCWV